MVALSWTSPTNLFSSTSFLGWKGGFLQTSTAFDIGDGQRLRVGMEWVSFLILLGEFGDVVVALEFVFFQIVVHGAFRVGALRVGTLGKVGHSVQSVLVGKSAQVTRQRRREDQRMVASFMRPLRLGATDLQSQRVR